jgi:DNA polymerase/3'-5' exonuclease PolX
VPKAYTQTVASLLREYAQRAALRGDNPYRTKAYSRAADSLGALAVPLDRLIEEDRLALQTKILNNLAIARSRLAVILNGAGYFCIGTSLPPASKVLT